jgi:hypothetical protein
MSKFETDQPALAYKFPEAAAISGMSRTTLYRAIARGELIARKYNGATLILRCDLEKFLQALPISTPRKK